MIIKDQPITVGTLPNDRNLKLEALKLAYSLCPHLRLFQFQTAEGYMAANKSLEEDLKHIFEIADLNYEYLMRK